MEKKISSIVVSSHRALKSFRRGLFLDLLILFLLFCKDQLFREGHKNLLNLPHGLNVCLVNVQTMRKIVQIFVPFSEKLNFNVVDLNNVHFWQNLEGVSKLLSLTKVRFITISSQFFAYLKIFYKTEIQTVILRC